MYITVCAHWRLIQVLQVAVLCLLGYKSSFNGISQKSCKAGDLCQSLLITHYIIAQFFSCHLEDDEDDEEDVHKGHYNDKPKHISIG